MSSVLKTAFHYRGNTAERGQLQLMKFFGSYLSSALCVCAYSLDRLPLLRICFPNWFGASNRPR